MNTGQYLPKLTLSTKSAFRLRELCEKLAVDISEDFDGYWSTCCEIIAGAAAAPLVPWLEDVSTFGYGLLSGLLLDANLPPTPHEHSFVGKLPIADAIVGSVAAHLGVLYTIEGKRQARHIHDVFYVPHDAETQLGSGCSELSWHVEDGCHPRRPDWVALLCLRGGRGVVTSVARSQDMLFSIQERAYLAGTQIRIRIDDSFEEAGPAETYIRTLRETADGLDIIYDPAYTVIDDVVTKSMIELVAREADRARCDLVLETGDLLLFNNRRSVHWRSAFDPASAAAERWIKRALVLSENVDSIEWATPGVIRG
jgi:L-asparagine oxygenase